MRKPLFRLLTLPLAVAISAGLLWMVAAVARHDLVRFELVGSAQAAEKKIKYWVAPMDPTFIRDEPGKSPMGMDLVPVYEDEGNSGSTISIDPVTAQNMGVRTAAVVKGDISRRIRTVGIIGFDEPEQ